MMEARPLFATALTLAVFLMSGEAESKVRFEKFGKCSRWCVGILHGERTHTCLLYFPPGKPGSPQFSFWTYETTLGKGETRFEIEVMDPRFKKKKGDNAKVSLSVLGGGPPSSTNLPDPITADIVVDNDLFLTLPLQAMGEVLLSKRTHLIISFDKNIWKYDIRGVDDQWSNFAECLKHVEKAY